MDERRVDRLSNLPESLILEVLLKLPTKDVVKTSVLSSLWRNLWIYVPRLELRQPDFPNYNAFASFVDRFLSFKSESCMQDFNITYDLDKDEMADDVADFTRWINTVVKRNVQHLHVFNWFSDTFIPPKVYTCESLVSLNLSGLDLASSNFVSLPSLKFMDLFEVQFADDLTLETLISGCPILASLSIDRNLFHKTKLLRVCSQSLLNFTYIAWYPTNFVQDIVAIDAPRLEYLKLRGNRTASVILKNPASLVKADISIDFKLWCPNIGINFDPNDLTKTNMIRNFLSWISCIKDMIITTLTLDVIYEYSRCEPLPLFCNLSFLRVTFSNYRWEMLPIFLESCPNLKSLVVGYDKYPEQGKKITSGPRCLLQSLEYVAIERALKGKAMEMELVSYLLENSAILKKLTLCLDDSVKNQYSVIYEELLSMPRLSSSCQIVLTEINRC